jgi:hypothetical protein
MEELRKNKNFARGYRSLRWERNMLFVSFIRNLFNDAYQQLTLYSVE